MAFWSLSQILLMVPFNLRRIPDQPRNPGKTVWYIPVWEKSGNLRKNAYNQGNIEDYDWPRRENGQSVIDSFSNSMFTQACGEERIM